MSNDDKPSLWQSMMGAVRIAGKAVTFETMKVWHVAQDPATPAGPRAVLYGALAYFVLPTDAVPDVLPFVGFTDDLAALGAALYVANAYVSEEALRRARESVRAIFG